MQNSTCCWHELTPFPNPKKTSEDDEVATANDYNVDTQAHDLYLHRF